MKILIFSASTGGGHKRAAAAIESKIKSLSPETDVAVVDAMKAIGKLFDDVVCGGYRFMATKTPKFYGKCYKITDRKTLMYKAVMRSNTLMSERLLKTIEEHDPDIVIICHPFITTMISKLRRQGKINVKAISLITDYAAHRTYIVPNIEAYVLAEPQMAKKLVEEYGVDQSIIYPLGIPVFDKFTSSFDKEKICKNEGLDPNLPTVLLMAGSFGVTAVADFYKNLSEQSKNIQIIVITGKNKKLYDKLNNLINESGCQKSTKLLYFVDNVEDYMHISDLIVTKPGGLTVTESLACKLPLAIYSALSGQEGDNAEFLTQTGAAVMLDKKDGADQIIELLSNKEKLGKMKEQCQKLFIPNSAENIFELAKKLCDA